MEAKEIMEVLKKYVAKAGSMQGTREIIYDTYFDDITTDILALNNNTKKGEPPGKASGGR